MKISKKRLQIMQSSQLAMDVTHFACDIDMWQIDQMRPNPIEFLGFDGIWRSHSPKRQIQDSPHDVDNTQ